MSTLYVLLVTVVSLSASDCLTHHPARLNLVGVHHSHRLHRRQTEPLTPTQMSTIVDLHNALRAREGADNMQLMTWDGYLASLAATWAAGCSWKHGHPSHNLPAAPGQNLYATSGQSVNLTAAIQHSWYASEKVHYDYDSQGCSGVCGHYTQIVWATSRQVGCAVHRCRPLTGLYDSGTYLVCNYYPPGNVRGQRPYTKGPACSRCGGGAGWCKNGLCNGRCSAAGEDCSCAATCYNCASLNAAACRCSCAKGWLGADCSVTCDDKHRYCGVSPGWPGPYLCDRDYVRANCPAMCGLCTPDKDAQPGQCPPVSGPGAHSSVGNRFVAGHHTTTAMFALVVAVLAISRGRLAA